MAFASVGLSIALRCVMNSSIWLPRRLVYRGKSADLFNGLSGPTRQQRLYYNSSGIGLARWSIWSAGSAAGT